VSPKPGATAVDESEASTPKIQQDQDPELRRSRWEISVFQGLCEAVLTNRLNGSFRVRSIYVDDQRVLARRQQLLIPQGTVLGEVKRHMLGQERLAVFFHRLIMPMVIP
jgi:hypothetical protein